VVRAAGRVATQSASDELAHGSKSTLQTESLPTSDPGVVSNMAPAHGLRSPSSFYHASSPYVHSNQISYKSIVGASQTEPVFCPPGSTEGPGMMTQALPAHRYLSPTERAHASLFSMMDAGRAPAHEFPVPAVSPPPVPTFARVPSASGEYINKPLAYKPSRIRRRAQSSYDPRTIDEADVPRQEVKPNGHRLSKFFGFGLAAKQKRDGGFGGTAGEGRDRRSSESAGSRMRKVQSTIDSVGEPWSVDSRPMTAGSDLGEFEDILCIRPGSYVGITGYAKLVEELEEDGEVSGDSEVSVSRSPNSEGSDDSVEDSKGDSDGDSGDDSVKDSVEDSVEDSVDTLVKVSDDGSEESKLELEIISVLVLLSESVLDSELVTNFAFVVYKSIPDS
ncbi:hypothetical protein GGH98_002057, partial [Coemansia sp. RSA 454]